MNATLVLCFSAAMLAAPSFAETLLATRAQKAAVSLPRGCIVTAEQTGAGAPVFSVAGRHEPSGVPPEKIIFEIGSISKIFTGMLLAQAVIEKKVTLDSTLRELMGTRHSFADANVAAITLRQLATHTSGLPRIPEDMFSGGDPDDPYAHYDRARLDASLAKTKLAHAPPFPSSYSNLGVGLLGDLLARLHGKSWEELVAERITRPLGLTDTCITLTAEQKKRLAPAYAGDQTAKPWQFLSLAGAGALHSTASDMLRFVQALGRPETTPLKEAIQMIEQPQDDGSIGLCLQITKFRDETGYWFAGGTGGFRSWISVKPLSSVMVVMLINNSSLSPEEVLSGRSPDKPAAGGAAKTQADPALADYTGDYDTGVKAGGITIHYRFEARGPDLWMQITGQPFIPLSRHPSAKDRFEFKPVKAEIQFTRRAGRITSTTLFQDGLEINATKLSAEGKAK